MKSESEFAGGSQEFNQSIIRGRLGLEVHNSFWNHARIANMLGTGLAEDLAKLRPVHPGKPVLLLGSGPSLDEALPLLRRWPHDVICSQSQAPTCVAYGKSPTYVVALDAEACMDHLRSPAGSWEETALVAHPGVHPSLFSEWPSRAYLFRCSSPNIPFYDVEQADGYCWRIGRERFQSMIDMRIGSFASSIGTQAAVAHLLQYRPIFLVGCDFGYPGNKPRFTERRWTGSTWEDRIGANLDSPPYTAENGCPTDASMLHSKRGLVMEWRLDKSPLVNCSPAGALGDLFPTADIQRVIDRRGRGFRPLTWKEAVPRADAYLARHHFYAVENFKGGMFFIEMPSLQAYGEALAKLKGRGAPINVAENMRRIRRAIKEQAA